MTIKKITLILFLLIPFSTQLYAQDFIGRSIDGSGDLGNVSKNKQGKVIGIKCPRSVTNNSVVNLNCGFSKTPGPVLVIKRGNSTLVTRFCKGIPCGNIKKAKSKKRVSNLSTQEALAPTITHQTNTNTNTANNKKEIRRENYKNGKPKSIAVILNNTIIDLTLYYPNGVKQYRRIIREHITSATHYYQNGKIRESYQFKSHPKFFRLKSIARGQAINTSREYYPSGRLYRETSWKDKRKAHVRIFDKNGKLRS